MNGFRMAARCAVLSIVVALSACGDSDNAPFVGDQPKREDITDLNFYQRGGDIFFS